MLLSVTRWRIGRRGGDKNTGIGDPAAEGYRLAYEGHVTQGPLHQAEPFPSPQSVH